MKSVSPKGITYTDEFKELFIAQNEKGKFPSKIFRDCGLNPEVVGRRRIDSASKRWREAYRKSGVMGLRDTRPGNSGRPRERELTPPSLKITEFFFKYSAHYFNNHKNCLDNCSSTDAHVTLSTTLHNLFYAFINLIP